MKISEFRLITFLALSLLMLVAVVVFANRCAAAFGDTGLRLQRYSYRCRRAILMFSPTLVWKSFLPG